MLTVSLSVGRRVRKRVSVCFVDFIFQKKLKSSFHKKKQDKTLLGKRIMYIHVYIEKKEGKNVIYYHIFDITRHT